MLSKCSARAPLLALGASRSAARSPPQPAHLPRTRPTATLGTAPARCRRAPWPMLQEECGLRVGGGDGSAGTAARSRSRTALARINATASGTRAGTRPPRSAAAAAGLRGEEEAGVCG
jgi:hypothetical protein